MNPKWPQSTWACSPGSVNKRTGEIIARVLTIEPTDESTRVQGYRITCAAGTGTLTATGAVQPAGKLEKIAVLIPDREAMKMALALRDHLAAWTVSSYWNRKSDLWKQEEQDNEH